MTGLDKELRSTLRGQRLILVASGVMLAIYLLMPTLIILPASFTSGDFIEVPPPGWSLRWYYAVFEDPTWQDALVISLKVSGLSALFSTVVATLAVIGIAHKKHRSAGIRAAFFLPMVLPYVVFALGLRQLFLPLGLTRSLTPLVVGQIILSLPVAFLVMQSAMANINPALIRAAQSMGASWFRIVLNIELPLLKRGLIFSYLLAFAFAFDEAVLPLFLAPPGNSTLPAKLYSEATQSITPLLASVSGLVIFITIIVAVAVVGLGRITALHRDRKLLNEKGLHQ